ncbi:MAG TPA: cysteine-rich CWC family protein [Casimicrobiaceae bacterium]
MDPSRCPLCGGPNDCAMAAGSSEPCWCTRATFPAELLDALDDAKGAACVCATCAKAAESPARTSRASPRSSS